MAKIIELARKNLIKEDISAGFAEIAKIMLKHNVGSVVIVEDGEIKGFIEDKTILRLLARHENPLEHKVSEHLSEFPTIPYDMDVLDAWEAVKDRKEERFALIDRKGKIIGIIRKRTINDFRIRIIKEELHIED